MVKGKKKEDEEASAWEGEEEDMIKKRTRQVDSRGEAWLNNHGCGN